MLQESLKSFAVSEGIERMSGKVDMYVKLLHKFQHNSEYALEVFLDFIGKGDMESAARTIHT